ncbi:penicillin-binding protein [Gracilibacillus halophilus YIM-C55.5]|uniref:Penicillin-binding protein n=1 Tax=Gracilibacillus halophilus YIM-C55.5 TaxID=1308866 RepID=N4WJF6_9BACI|nr:penicillin-binding protein [Gracilibacillus halophilus YIM-C55.5]
MSRRRRRRKKHRLIKFFIFISFMLASFMGVILLASYLLGPPELARDQNTIYYSEDQEVIGEEHGLEQRYWVSLDNIDQTLIDATIWTEDQHFYDHFGFDFKRLLGAIWTDIKTMSLKEGASTITQQYARNLYLTHEKTWKRKLYEAFYTIRLEMFYDKDKLLEGYLNTIYYGHGAYGIEAASRYYFDKSADELTLEEAALLAGIPKGPSIYSPFHNYDRAKERQEQILANLHEHDVIDKATYSKAVDAPLPLSEDRSLLTQTIAPYFQDVVVEELQDILDVDIEDIRSGGYQVYTTLNTEQQTSLQQATKEVIGDNDIQIGSMAMNPNSGAVTALVGGTNYQESNFNRVVQAKRMPGSSFKPFLYYTALENGMTPATTLMSKPTTFALRDGKSYQPSNYNGYYADRPITMAQALALSDNIYAVKTNLFVTPEKVVETATDKFGIDSELDPVASLALGTEVVTVKEMVNAYSRIANGGKATDAFTIHKVTDTHGNVLYDREEEEEEQDQWSWFSEDDSEEFVLQPQTTYILTDLMKGIFREELNGYMPVTGASVSNQISRDYAAKSGTTDGDQWMIGFSPSLTAGVWVGYDDNREITNVEEKGYAKEIWVRFMEKAHESLPEENYKRPEDLIKVAIDLETGKRAAEGCNHTYDMFFVEGTEPTTSCKDALEENELGHPEEIEQITPDDDLIDRWWQWLITGNIFVM